MPWGVGASDALESALGVAAAEGDELLVKGGLEQDIAGEFAVLLALTAEQPAEDRQVGGAQAAVTAEVSGEHAGGDVGQQVEDWALFGPRTGAQAE